MVEDKETLAGRSGHIVGEECHYSEHGKTAVLELFGLVFSLRGAHQRVLQLAEESLSPAKLIGSSALRGFPADELPVADRDDNLQPSERRNSTDGSNSIRNRA